jgi:hypothetical protein
MILLLLKTQSWDIVKITLFEIKKLTSEIVGTKLQQEANQHLCKTTFDTAMIACNAHKKGRGQGGIPVGSSWKAKPNDKCNYCHKKGIGQTNVRNVSQMRKIKVQWNLQFSTAPKM